MKGIVKQGKGYPRMGLPKGGQMTLSQKRVLKKPVSRPKGKSRAACENFFFEVITVRGVGATKKLADAALENNEETFSLLLEKGLDCPSKDCRDPQSCVFDWSPVGSIEYKTTTVTTKRLRRRVNVWVALRLNVYGCFCAFVA